MPSFQFYCCLPGRERTVLDALAMAYAVSLGQPIPVVLYDVLWLAPVPSNEARKTGFLGIYGLQRQLIFDPVSETVSEMLVITAPAWWIAFAAFLTTEAAQCLDGCGFPEW